MSMMLAVQATLPPVHEKHKDISLEDSQQVMRLMSVVYEVMQHDPRWYACAVEATAASTGIGHVTVHEIYTSWPRTSTM